MPESDKNEYFAPKRSVAKAGLIFAASLVLAIAISVGMFAFRDNVADLGNYGYLGAFLLSLITSATVVLPVPGIIALIALGTTFNPLLIGVVGGTGSILGETVGFMVGFGGKGVIQGRSYLYTQMEKWMRRWGSWAVFLFASFPLPLFDLAGIVAGALGYPLWKFLLIGWIGKIIKTTVLVFAGLWGWEAIMRLLT